MNLKRLFFLLPVFIFVALGCNAVSSLPFGATPTALLPTVSPTETAPPSSPLTGLIYSVNDYDAHTSELWQFDKDGKAQLVVDNVGLHPILSPDGKQLIYTGDDHCIWWVNAQAHESKPLDCSYIEEYGGMHFTQDVRVKSWIFDQPDTLFVFLNANYYSGDGGFPGSYTGRLGTFSLLDGKKTTLGSTDSITLRSVALSPDGKSIAYDDMLYSFDTGLKKFDSKKYGVADVSVRNPAWSPDSKKLAWGVVDSGSKLAVGIFDLEKKTAQILHRYSSVLDPYGFGVPSPEWSPDGKWVVFYAGISTDEYGSDDKKQSAYWVLQADGKAEYKLDGDFNSWSSDGKWLLYWKKDASDKSVLMVSEPDGTNTTQLKVLSDQRATWSPDGRYLALVDRKEEIIWMAEAGVWEFSKVTSSLPSNVSLFNWLPTILTPYGKLKAAPTFTPNAISSFSCPQAPRTRFNKVGETGRITFTDGSSTRLRAKPEGGDNMVANLAEGTEFSIVDGPVCYPRPGRNDSYVYWKIKVTSKDLTGWVAEADFKNYYIEPWPK